VRLFVALMTTPIQEQIFEIEEGLKKQITDVKWVKKDNLHLTLKFLGDVDKVKFELIKEIIVNIGSQCKEFDFSFSRISGFPKEEAARVIFIGLDKGTKEIKEIMIKLDEETCKMGFKREKACSTSTKSAFPPNLCADAIASSASVVLPVPSPSTHVF